MIQTIEEFLRVIRPDGPWVLSAISADKGNIDSRTFDDAVAAVAWAQLQNKQRNGLYVHVNKMRADAPRDTKAAKVHVECVEYFHADLDARPLPPIENESTEDRRKRAQQHVEAERARCLDVLKRYKVRPTLVVNSGSGMHGWWKLRPGAETALDGTEARADVFALFNKKLAQDLEGDNVHDVSRLLRLPFLTNWVNKQKGEKGRSDAPTSIVEYNPDAVYNLSEFEPAAMPRTLSPSRALAAPKGVQPPVNVGTDFSVEGIRAWFAANGKAMDEQAESALAFVATGTHPIEPNRYRGDRSRAVFAAACMLVRAGAPNELIAGALLDPNNEISAHVRDQKRAAAYAMRQADQARRKVAEEDSSGSGWDCTDKHGNPIRSYPNTVAALTALGVECRHDLFRNRNLVGHRELQEFAGEFSDQAESVLRREIRLKFGFDPGKENVKDAVLELCTQNRFDSLVDHLDELSTWDGVGRLDTWLPVYLGTVDTAYTRGAGAAWLLAAVARAMTPGTKFDHMLVLIGAQGVGKSSALRMLAGDDLYTDANFLGAKDTREVLEATTGAWIVECAELAGMRHKDTETLKYEITKQEDKGRHAYARNPVTVPRRFVLAGTTNSARFLHDDTGNRRFWPVEVTRVDFAALKRDRDQLLAEALARFRSGQFQLFLSGEAAAGAEREQGNRHAVDLEYVDVLRRLEGDVVDDREHALHGLEVVTNDAVFGVLLIPAERRRGNTGMEVRRAMTALGWQAPESPVMWPIDPAAPARRKQRVYARPATTRAEKPASTAPSEPISEEFPF